MYSIRLCVYTDNLERSSSRRTFCSQTRRRRIFWNASASLLSPLIRVVLLVLVHSLIEVLRAVPYSLGLLSLTAAAWRTRSCRASRWRTRWRATTAWSAARWSRLFGARRPLVATSHIASSCNCRGRRVVRGPLTFVHALETIGWLRLHLHD